MSETPRSQRLAAIGFMLAASMMLAGTSLLAKVLGRDVLGPALHPLQISHGRFLFALLGLILVVAVLRPRFTRPHLAIHVARTSCGWAGISLLFAAIAYIPLPDATAISFLNPVFAMVLAIPILGERVGPVRWAAAAIALAGALVLLRPTAGSFQPAVLLAFSAAAIMGLEIILIKMLSNRERPLQILLTNNAIGFIIATVAVGFFWANPVPQQWAALIMLGLMMVLAQSCFIQSLRRVETSLVLPFSYTTLVFAAAYDYMVFGAVPDVTSALGAAIIIAGAVLLAWRETRLKSPENSRT